MEVKTEKEIVEEITEANARDLPGTVLNLKVVDARTYELMANGRALLKKAWQFFEDRSRPRISEAHEHWKNLLADLKKDQSPIDQALTYANKQLGDYDAEQTRLANLEAARLQAEQKKRDDDEKMQLAELAEKAGEKQLAADILDAPSEAPPVYVAKEVPKVAGLSYREDWKFEIGAWQKIPAKFHRMEKNPKGEWSCKCLTDLRIEVERLKQTADIPGIRVFSVKVPIGRG